MKQNGITRVFRIASLLAVLFVFSACAGQTTPPGANIISGSLITPKGLGGSYALLQWNEGLSISIVHDSQGAHESSGSGSTEDPFWRGQGNISTENSQVLTWRVETADGKTVKFYIDEQSYDLNEGTLFLVRTVNGAHQIQQHQSSHTGSCSDDASCQQLLRQDPAVLQFMQQTIQLVAAPDAESAPTMPTSAVTGEAPISAGWTTHTSQQCEYAISYPADIQVQSQTPYSDLLVFNLSDPEEGARNFVYVSVVTPDIQQMAEQGVYNYDVYNFDSAVTETLLKMDVGESKSVHTSLNTESGFTYQRQPDTVVRGYAAQAYENLRPWEFPEGTKETRYYISLNGCTYLIGGYMDTAGSNLPGVMTEELFRKIIATIRLTP